MSAARRLVLVPIGLLLAIPAGAMFLMAGALAEPAARELAGTLSFSGFTALLLDFGEDHAFEALGVLVFGTMLLVSVLLIAPLTFVVLLGELLQVRTYVWYAGACGALTASIPWLLRGGPLTTHSASAPAQAAELRITLLLFLTGVVSGFVYWLVAGRTAGPERTGPVMR